MHGTIRWAEQARENPAVSAKLEARRSDGECLTFVLARGAPLRIAQAGTEILLRAHEACLLEHPQTETLIPLGCALPLRIYLSKSRLCALSPSTQQHLRRPLPVRASLTDLISGYLATISGLSPCLDTSARQLASHHVVELVALALAQSHRNTHPANESGEAPNRLAEIKADILANIARPDLTLDDIAQRNRISPRCLQRLFEKEGSTISAFVLEQRLSLAAKLLRDPLQPDRKISDVAFSSGFNDLSYFNRAFRRRFGVTPSEARSDKDGEA